MRTFGSDSSVEARTWAISCGDAMVDGNEPPELERVDLKTRLVFTRRAHACLAPNPCHLNPQTPLS